VKAMFGGTNFRRSQFTSRPRRSGSPARR
jgi:hypothetical protein